MESTIIYPNKFALQVSLNDFCSRRFVDIFAQERGIFISNATQSDLGDYLSGLFFDRDDLSQIHHEALHVYKKNSLSGFWVSTNGDGINLLDELERSIGKIVEPKNSMTLGQIIKKDGLGDDYFIGSVGYLQRQPGRVEFLNEVERSFEFYIKEVEPNRWQILVDGHRAQDAQILEDWFPTFSVRNYQVVTIDQGELNNSETVAFFDQLSTEGMSEAWEFTQVKKITLRKSNTQDDEEETRNETDQSVLSGISQAILEGKDLRHNSFVKQCENGGYRFTAMTYEYSQKEHPYVIEIRAEFKGRPKLFEVATEKSTRRVGPEEKLEDFQFPEEQILQMLTTFYGKAKLIFDAIVT